MIARRLSTLQIIIATAALIATIIAPAGGEWLRSAVIAAWILSVAMAAGAGMAPALLRPIRAMMQRPLLARLFILIWLFICLPLPFAPLIMNSPALLANGNGLAVLLYVPFGLFWAWVTAILWTTVSETPIPLLGRLGALTVGLALSLVLLEILLRLAVGRLAPNLIKAIPYQAFGLSSDINPVARIFQSRANQSADFFWDERQGDLIRFTCLSIPDDFTPQPRHVQLQLDRYGMRNTEPLPDSVHTVIVGDSFTDAYFVADPYWKNLTDSQIVLGSAGSGTLEEVAILREVGLNYDPHLIVVVFYEGNDMSDNLNYAQKSVYPDLLHLSFLYNAVEWGVMNAVRDYYYATAAKAHCNFPVKDQFEQELAFLPIYLGNLTASAEEVRASRAFAYTQQAILDLEQIAEERDATLVIAYAPQKARVHWQFLSQEAQIQAATGAQQFTMTPDSPARGLSPEAFAAQITQNLDSQRDVLAAFANEHNILFVDFTPALEAAAAEGQSPYCFSDTHWCELGHQIAHDVLQAALEQAGLVP